MTHLKGKRGRISKFYVCVVRQKYDAKIFLAMRHNGEYWIVHKETYNMLISEKIKKIFPGKTRTNIKILQYMLLV